MAVLFVPVTKGEDAGNPATSSEEKEVKRITREVLCTEREVSVTFLDRQGLKQYLDSLSENFNKTTSGILQKFTTPQTRKNEVYRVAWSRHSCDVQRRLNVNMLDDERQETYCRALTFEDDGDLESLEKSMLEKPSPEIQKRYFGVSKTSIVSSETHWRLIQRFRDICKAITDHLTEMPSSTIGKCDLFVGYFKVTSNQQFYLSWAEEILFQK